MSRKGSKPNRDLPTPAEDKIVIRKPRRREGGWRNLRDVSSIAREVLEDKVVLHVNDFAELVEKRVAESTKEHSMTGTHVRRRLYDFVQVMVCLRVVTKDKKMLYWHGMSHLMTKEPLQPVRYGAQNERAGIKKIAKIAASVLQNPRLAILASSAVRVLAPQPYGLAHRAVQRGALTSSNGNQLVTLRNLPQRSRRMTERTKPRASAAARSCHLSDDERRLIQSAVQYGNLKTEKQDKMARLQEKRNKMVELQNKIRGLEAIMQRNKSADISPHERMRIGCRMVSATTGDEVTGNNRQNEQGDKTSKHQTTKAIPVHDIVKKILLSSAERGIVSKPFPVYEFEGKKCEPEFVKVDVEDAKMEPEAMVQEAETEGETNEAEALPDVEMQGMGSFGNGDTHSLCLSDAGEQSASIEEVLEEARVDPILSFTSQCLDGQTIDETEIVNDEIDSLLIQNDNACQVPDEMGTGLVGLF